MSSPAEQREEPVSEERASERQALNALLEETPPYDTYSQLEQLFSKLTKLQELPQRIERLKLFPSSYLSLIISPSNFNVTRKAISYLYPESDTLIPELKSLYPSPTQTFAFSSALVRYWAVLSSDRLKMVIDALARLDISEILQEIGKGDTEPQRLKYRAINEISSCLRCLNASKRDVLRLIHPEMVTLPTIKELELIVNDRKPYIRPIARIPAISAPPPRQIDNDHKLILCIDPYNEISDILDKVREIIEAHHTELKEEFEKQNKGPRGRGAIAAIAYNPNPLRHPFNVFKEMDMFLAADDRELFNEIGPLQYFQLKEKGDKGRDTQKVIDDCFYALITYELRRRDIRPVDIERRYFGLTAASGTKAYKAQTKAHSDRYKRAERLISRALACAPIQL